MALSIRRRRDELGWSARELAERCAALGMPSLTRVTIAKIENHSRGIGMEELAVLAAALGVRFDELTSEQVSGERAITILHLAGLGLAAGHLFGAPVVGQDNPHLELCNELAAELKSLDNTIDGARPDLVVVTGDLARTGRPREYDLVKAFLETLAERLGLGFERIAIVPGSRDVNLQATKAYFAECDADEVEPRRPYWSNWSRFAALFGAWPDAGRVVRMQAEQPWSLYEIKDLKVVLAGLNSTVEDGPDRTGHGGEIGIEQAQWFAEALRDYERQGWLRIGLVHHDPLGGRAAGDGDLGDTATFDGLLGPRLNLLLHGNDAGAGVAHLPSGLLTLGAGRAPGAEPDRGAANRCQLLRISADGVVRVVRRYDLDRRRWQPDGSARRKPSWSAPIQEPFRAVHGTFPAGSAGAADAPAITMWHNPGAEWVAGEPIDESPPALDARRLLLDRVADVCVARQSNAVVHRIKGDPPYLRVTYVEQGHARQLRIGACVGPFGETEVDQFHARVHAIDDALESTLVFNGAEPADALRHYAARRDVRLTSFLQFQGLVDLSGYVQSQARALASDQRYPESGYVPHRFTDALNPHGPVHTDVIAALIDQVSADDGRFVLLLGDFGRGKTYAMRQLARRILDERPHLTPILIDLRALDKTHTLEAHVAAHLAAHRHDDIDMRALRYMLEQGRIVLIFDGFDELVARATYERAADHLATLISGATERAKIVVASRTQHFQTHGQVLTAMGAQVGALAQRRILTLSDLSQEQIRTMLLRRYGNDEVAVDERIELLSKVPGLMALAQNPRMLGFIADLDEERLRAVAISGGVISPASLYEQILHNWLSLEEARTQSIPGAPLGLRLAELWTAVTTLALRMWETGDALVGVDELGIVARDLTELAGGHLSEEQIAYAVGAGSLLVRTDEGLFGFIHESVAEWLVARHLASVVDARPVGPAPLLERKTLTSLTVDFLCGLADPTKLRGWADAELSRGSRIGRDNATKVLARLSSSEGLDLRGADLNGENLSDRAWPDADLSGANFTGARMANMNLRGAILRDARLVDVSLDSTDLTDADLSGADLRGARVITSRLIGARLDGALLNDARLLDSDLTGVSAHDAVWRRAALIKTTADPGLVRQALAGGAAVLTGGPAAGAAVRLQSATMPPEVGVRFGFEEGRFPRPVAYDADGVLLAIGNEDGSVLICDAASGAPIRTLVGHEWRSYAVTFSPTEPLLATGSVDETVRLWDANTGECLHILEGHQDWVWPMLFNKDGTLLAAGASDGVVRVWDIRTGQLRWRLPGHDTRVFTATFDDGGRFLATGDDVRVQLWDINTGELHRSLETDGASTYWLRFNPAGTWLAAGGSDGAVRLWSPGTGELVHRLAGHRASIYSLDFHPTAGYLVSADTQGSLRRWDRSAATGEVSGREIGKHTGAVYRITFSPDGRRFATGDSDGDVWLWDAESCSIVHELGRHHASVWPMMFRPDGAQLATSSNDFTTKLWDTESGENLHTLRGHGRQMRAVAFNSDSSLLATSGNDGVVRLWSPHTGQCVRVLKHQADQLISVVFSPSAPELATASNDGRVYLWDAQSGKEGRVLLPATDYVWATAFHRDGEQVAIATDDENVKIMLRSTGRLRNTLVGEGGRVRALAFNPDGDRLATGGDDTQVRIWDWEAERADVLPQEHSGRIFSLAYNHDGNMLATASHDETVVIWNVADRSVLHRLRPGRGKLWSVAFHPDGELLATAGDKEVIDIWSVRTGRRVFELSGHNRRVWSVVFSPNGEFLASSSTDGTVRLWRTASAEPAHAATLLGLPNGWVAFGADGRHKADGAVSGEFWHIVGMCRFEPGELDQYLPETHELSADAPLL
ncbi:WD40 domain-containing protein [Asanoa ferruginea]|uniref:WD40 domain-containing protein n=1 Tax=Asanoa ferruginea TaxID=53367 RepID=UPI0011C1B2FD|nr:pentapeptide repeat-containing protein [Asanoa ferruginea]